MHHFTEPVWFHDMGAFEKEENIDVFVSYSKFIFSEFSSKVKIWCTINEPSVYTTHGYFTGIFPPGKKNANIAVNVLKNLLQLHVEIYLALKDMPNGNDCQIGIVKNINQFEPYRRHSIMDWMVSLINNQFFNNSVINFFKTGVFKIRIPGLAWIKCYNKKAIGAMDFIGLNYYSHNHVKFKFDPKEFFELKFLSKDTMTDMPYTIYAEGFYRALHQISILNKPIIVTENGIADKKDKNRERYINEYLYALFRALEDGIDVRGYYYWSLLDNFEWAFGYDMKFGLYQVDFKTQKRILREGSKAYQKIVQDNALSKISSDPGNIESLWTLSLLKILSNRPYEADIYLKELELLLPNNPWPSAYRSIVNLASWNPWKASLIAENSNRKHQHYFLKALSDISTVCRGGFWRLTSSFKSVPFAIEKVDQNLNTNVK